MCHHHLCLNVLHRTCIKHYDYMSCIGHEKTWIFDITNDMYDVISHDQAKKGGNQKQQQKMDLGDSRPKKAFVSSSSLPVLVWRYWIKCTKLQICFKVQYRIYFVDSHLFFFFFFFYYPYISLLLIVCFWWAFSTKYTSPNSHYNQTENVTSSHQTHFFST